MAGKKDVVRDVLELAGEFVIKRKGCWEHKEWESFLKKAGKAGAPTDDAGQVVLGAVLEAAKGLYHSLEEAVPHKAEKKVRAEKPVKAEKAVKAKKETPGADVAAPPVKPVRKKLVQPASAE